MPGMLSVVLIIAGIESGCAGRLGLGSGSVGREKYTMICRKCGTSGGICHTNGESLLRDTKNHHLSICCLCRGQHTRPKMESY